MRSERERFLLEKEAAELSNAELLELLRLRHSGDEPPACPVCGGVLTQVNSGNGPTKWACTMWEADPAFEGKMRRKPDRRLLDDHFAASVWVQRRHTEPWVLELVRRVENWASVLGDTSLADDV